MSVDEKAKPAPADKDFLSTFARGLELIKSFDSDNPTMALTEVARKNDMSRAAARRFLLTLQRLGYVASDGRQFRLTPRILELGYSYLATVSFAGTVTPFMEEVVHLLNESCSASVLDDADIVYVARIPVRRLMPINLQVGARLPAFCTSMGRVLLAALSDERLDDFLGNHEFQPLTVYTQSSPEALRSEVLRVREQGYALVDQELELGLRSVAVPVFDRHGHVAFALNVSAHVSKGSIQQLQDEFVPVLRRISREMSASLP